MEINVLKSPKMNPMIKSGTQPIAIVSSHGKDIPIYIAKGNKKYEALVDGNFLGFGDKRFMHYYDKIGHYAKQNHLDKKRRELYKLRHQNNRNVLFTPGWLSDQLLW